MISLLCAFRLVRKSLCGVMSLMEACGMKALRYLTDNEKCFRSCFTCFWLWCVKSIKYLRTKICELWTWIVPPSLYFFLIEGGIKVPFVYLTKEVLKEISIAFERFFKKVPLCWTKAVYLTRKRHFSWSWNWALVSCLKEKFNYFEHN